MGFSTWVSRYLAHGGLGAAGSAAEAWFLRVGTRFRGPFFTVSNALHGETPRARRGSTDVGVSCYIPNPEPEHVTSVTHHRKGATGPVEMVGLSPEGFGADGSLGATKLFAVSFST